LNEPVTPNPQADPFGLLCAAAHVARVNVERRAKNRERARMPLENPPPGAIHLRRCGGTELIPFTMRNETLGWRASVCLLEEPALTD